MTKKARRSIMLSTLAMSLAVAASASALQGHFYFQNDAAGTPAGAEYDRCSFTGPFRRIYANFTSWTSQGAVSCSNLNGAGSGITTHIGPSTCTNASATHRIRIRTSDAVLCSGPVVSWTAASACNATVFSKQYWPYGAPTWCEDRSFSALSWGN